MSGHDSRVNVVAGDVMLDIFLRGSVARLSPEASCPVFRHGADDVLTELGGTARVARYLRRLGMDVELRGAIGDDAEGRHLSALLDAEGIADSLSVQPHTCTTTKTRVVDSAGHTLLRIDRDGEFHPVGLQLPCDANLLLSDYRKGALGGGAFEICRRNGGFVMVDAKCGAPDDYRGATLLKGNRMEMARILGVEPSVEAIAGAMSATAGTGIAMMVATLGEEGIIGMGPGGELTVLAAYPVCHPDVTGAGDAVSALLFHALTHGKTLPEAMETANAGAAFVVSVPGASRQPAGLKTGVAPEVMRLTDRRMVFTNGCFDMLHPGHVDLLQKAKALGDFLVVGVDTDSRVSVLKGAGRPVVPLHGRMDMLAALDCVDFVVPFGDGAPTHSLEDLISLLRPGVLVKGGDYAREDIVGASIVEATGGRVEIIPREVPCSTSGILNKINGHGHDV